MVICRCYSYDGAQEPEPTSCPSHRSSSIVLRSLKTGKMRENHRQKSLKVEFVRRTLRGGTQRNSEKSCASPNFCVKLLQKLCSYNFHADVGEDGSEVPKMFLQKFCTFLKS